MTRTTKAAERKLTDTFKAAKREQKVRDVQPLQEQPWYKEFDDSFRHFSNDYLQRLVTKDRRNQRIAAAARLRSPQSDIRSFNWNLKTGLVSYLAISQPVIGTYATVNSGANPFIDQSNRKPDEEKDRGQKGPNSGGKSPTYGVIPDWVLSSFYSSSEAPPGPSNSEKQGPESREKSPHPNNDAPRDKRSVADSGSDLHRNVYRVTAAHSHNHRHRGHAHEAHQPNGTVYPYKLNSFTMDMIQGASFEDMLAAEIRHRGQDPNELLEVRFASLSSLSALKKQLHETPTEWWTRNEVAYYLSVARVTWQLSGHSLQAKNFINAIRLDDDIGNKAIARYHGKQAHKAKEKFKTAAEELESKFGMNIYNKKGRFKYVYLNHPYSNPPSPRHPHGPRGELAVIFETHKGAKLHRFMIDLHSDPLIHEIPTKSDDFQAWMRTTGKQIAFKKSSTLPDDGKFYLSDCNSDERRCDNPLQEHHFHSGIVKYLIGPIVRKTTETAAKLIGRECAALELLHLAAGLCVPWYDVLNALRLGDYKYAVIYAGLEIVPIVGQVGKFMVKIASHGLRYSTTLTRTASFASHWGPEVFDQAKNLHNALPQLETWHEDAGGQPDNANSGNSGNAANDNTDGA